MAVRKTKKAVEEEVKVDVTPVEEVSEEKVAEEPKKDEDPFKVEVDTEAIDVEEDQIPNKKVKIRMRVDHHCTIAMVRYDFKAGKCYDVPANVKLILDGAGLLSPL